MGLQNGTVQVYNVDPTKPVVRPNGQPVLLKWGSLVFPRPKFGAYVTIAGTQNVKLAQQMVAHNGFGLSFRPPVTVTTPDGVEVKAELQAMSDGTVNVNVEPDLYPVVPPAKAKPSAKYTADAKLFEDVEDTPPTVVPPKKKAKTTSKVEDEKKESE